jgi:hypothetical protein
LRGKGKAVRLEEKNEKYFRTIFLFIKRFIFVHNVSVYVAGISISSRQLSLCRYRFVVAYAFSGMFLHTTPTDTGYWVSGASL